MIIPPGAHEVKLYWESAVLRARAVVWRVTVRSVECVVSGVPSAS